MVKYKKAKNLSGILALISGIMLTIALNVPFAITISGPIAIGFGIAMLLEINYPDSWYH
jgi:hypothetical protein